MTREEALSLLESQGTSTGQFVSRYNEDQLTDIEVALFGGDRTQVRNKYHDLGEGPGAVHLLGRVNARGGVDLMRQEFATQGREAETKKRVEELLRDALEGPTAADKALVEKIIGGSADIARRELAATMPILTQQESAKAASRGLLGSSAEAANRALVGAQATRSVADMLSQQQMQGAQMLAELPFKRAELGINANQLLFNNFMSGITPFMNYRLTLEQLRAQRQQQKSSFNPMDIIKMGAGYAVGGPAGAAAAAGINSNVGQRPGTI